MELRLLFLFLVTLWATEATLSKCEDAESCVQCANATDSNGVKCEWCSIDETCRSYILSTCPLEDRIPHPYGCPAKSRFDIYDEDFTRDVVLPLIGATHSSDNDQLTSTLTSCFKKHILVNSYKVFCDKATNLTTCFAYMVRFPSRNALAIIFRGTVGYYQLIDEGISFFLYEKVPYEPTGGKVDHYYRDAFHKLWNSGMERDFKEQLQRHPDTQIWCFGHSLGGGLASLAATYIAHSYKRDDVQLTTFGQPRIGDIEFAIGHDRLVPNSVRVINKADPIPSMPPRSFGLGDDMAVNSAFHHKYEVWYPFDMKRGAYYQVGREPDQFSTSASVLHFVDHLYYFETDIDKFPLKGCRVKH